MFVYNDKNVQFLNAEIDLRLKELTAQGLIKSEEEYRNLIENILSGIDSNLLRITDVKRYLVKSDGLVNSKQLNALFTDLESDMRVLHNNIKDINRILDITFERNKLFYRRIKNRIASIWKEIQKFRETSFNIESSTYTFFESFSENAGMYLTGLSIDKKTGTLTLAPMYIDSFSDGSEVASVDMTLHPVGNSEGGVIETTNPKNTFAYNYTNGDRTLLKDGLWKIQMLTATIPEVILDVFGRGTNTMYRGILAEVDIKFVSPKIINEINIDPYGDFNTKVVGIQYMTNENSDWMNLVDEDGVVVTGSDVDWISLRNFVPVTAHRLKIVFHQPNFQLVSKLMNQVDTMVDKMVRALIEQRFEKINYQYKQPDEYPSYDTNEEADLYDEIMKIIEEGGDITTLENQIKELLIPRPVDLPGNITNWKLFNLGAWSIDPRNIGYAPQSIGVYVSHDPRDKTSGYKMNNGSPNYVRLYTKQTQPESSSIQWSLLADVDGINFVEIPIMPNNDIWRHEAANYGVYFPLKNSNRRTITTHRNLSHLLKLDFPVHPSYQSVLEVLENGKPFTSENFQYFEFYNSTELYISTADFVNGNVYTVKYVPAAIDTVKCYTLVPDTMPNPGQIDLGSMCVFATEAAARSMADALAVTSYDASKPSDVVVAKKYRIVSQLCTRKEYDGWFRSGRVNTFLDSALDNDDDRANQIDWFTKNHKFLHYHSDVTRTTWLYRNTDIVPYSESDTDLYSWKELLPAIPSITNKRKQY